MYDLAELFTYVAHRAPLELEAAVLDEVSYPCIIVRD